MDKLLQEAIADAKAVRETALANAKLALEEAFTPHLKSMLSKKLQAEMENEEEEADASDDAGEPEDAAPMDGDESVDEELAASGIGASDNKQPSAAASEDDGQGPEEEGSSSEVGSEDDEQDETSDQAMGEQYEQDEPDEEEEEAPEAFADEQEAPEEEPEMEPEPEEEDVDLEQVLRELEAEMSEEEGEEEEEAPEAPAPEEPAPEEEPEDDELDLEQIIRALSEEGDDEEEAPAPAPEEEPEDEESIAAELKEYKQTVMYLKEKLSEVNLLNAKLLYTNKLFRSRNISQEQKMRVIEQFDRATNVREVKLVYTTFAESMKRKPVNESARRKSQASKPSASTKGKRAIIGEQVDFKTRMKKLANII